MAWYSKLVANVKKVAKVKALIDRVLNALNLTK